MTRAITTPIEVPREQALAIAEICEATSDSKGGLLRIAKCLNTLYDQFRGELVADGGDPICDSAGRTIAYYRPRVSGRSGLTEDAQIYIEVTASTATISVTVGSASAVTWTGSAATRTWVSMGQATGIGDTAEYLDVEVEITAGTAEVLSIAIYHPRDRSTLPAVAAGSDGYATSGYVPLDTDGLVDGAPLSVARLLDMHADAIYLLTSRPGQIIQTANPYRDDDFWWSAQRPTAPTGTATARFYVRADGAGTETITISGSGESDTATAPSSEGWVGPFDLEISCQSDLLTAPLWADFTLDPDGANIYSISGWWRDIDYD